jgi:hypothetical protein
MISLSSPASEALEKVQSKMMRSFDAGTSLGHWRPSKAKVVEFLCWLYERLCEQQKLEMVDVTFFVPVTAPQGRKRVQPTLHQVSVASKMLGDRLQREPTHEEVMAFIKRNPDVGWCPNSEGGT